MNIQLNLGQSIVIGICAALILAYIRGYFYNRQQAQKISAWLQKGMQPWGHVNSGAGKLPGMASGGRLEVQEAAAPLKNMEAIFLLAPRENPLFWIFYAFQGKRDELIVWITFKTKPEQAVEVARTGDPQFDKRLKAADKPALKLVEAPPGFQVGCEEKEDAILADKVLAFVQRYPRPLRRLVLRDNKPHLFLRANLQGVQAIEAEEFFKGLSELRK